MSTSNTQQTNSALRAPNSLQETTAENRTLVAEPATVQALRACLGAIDAMRTQIQQMQGLFDDSDGTIAEALEAASEAQSAAIAALKPAPSHFVLVQEGGSTGELYIHGHTTRQDAERDRIECAAGAYRTTPLTEVPGDLATHPKFYDVLEAVVDSMGDLDYPTPARPLNKTCKYCSSVL
uniref:hypothetical protein n=1 Tax=Cupriavidus gilardii TaxID=82541 RepID=UPI00247B04F9|nr:hypothetical protein [Cupriavidus gilardii]WDE72672.1 hypothetical protein [Cupriavidus gilardii]